MRRIKVLALQLLLFVNASAAVAIQPGTKIPTQEIDADVAPFKLFLVHNSICEFRTEFVHSEFGAGSFSFDLNPKRPYSSPDVYLEKDAGLGKQNSQLNLFLMNGDKALIGWDLNVRVEDISLYHPEAKQRFLYRSRSFVEDLAVDMPKSDGIIVAINKQVIFETKFPKGGAYFLDQVKKCTAAKEAASRADSK